MGWYQRRVHGILSKSLATNFLIFIYFLILCKLLFIRNHFLNFLIILEVFMVVGYMTIMREIYFLNSSLSFMFLFMVIMVIGACVGMSLLVVLTRLINKELEVRIVSL